MKIKKLLIPILLIAAAIFLLLSEFDYKLTLPGKVYASREWMVIKGGGGEIFQVLQNHFGNVTEEYSMLNFERGDLVNLTLSPEVRKKMQVNQGDVIGSLGSSALDLQIAELSGEIDITTATLKLDHSGAKESVIDEMKNNLHYAQESAKQQKRLFDRAVKLHSEKLISEQEFEVVSNRYKLAEINVKIAEVRLTSAATGSKPERIKLVETQLLALREQVEILKKRGSSLTLISPVSGVLVPTFSRDTLLTVRDYKTMTVVIPIDIKHLRDFQNLSKQEILFPELDSQPEILNILLDETVHWMYGTEMVLLFLEVDNEEMHVMAGQSIQFRINSGKMPGYQHLLRFMN